MSCDQCEGRGKVDTVVPGELDDCPACGVCPTCGSLHPDWDEVGEFVPAQRHSEGRCPDPFHEATAAALNRPLHNEPATPLRRAMSAEMGRDFVDLFRLSDPSSAPLTSPSLDNFGRCPVGDNRPNPDSYHPEEGS
jgi:hypothetical protein